VSIGAYLEAPCVPDGRASRARIAAGFLPVLFPTFPGSVLLPASRRLAIPHLKIVAKLVSSGQVYELSARLGYGIEEFCRDLIATITQATKVVRIYDRGRVVGVFEDPDLKARTAARWQWMRAVGIDKLPLTAPGDELAPEPSHG